MVKQILIAIDQLINALFGGWADETLSSRAYRHGRRGVFSPLWALGMSLIDTVFFWQVDHCKSSYESEKLRMQLPPELRNTTGGTENL